MKTLGIITIHKIYNYGSVLQAYALQEVCENLGFKVEIIDYTFPNDFQKSSTIDIKEKGKESHANEPKWIKTLFAKSLMRQHKKISNFVSSKLHLSNRTYNHPDELKNTPPVYDVYVSGSDQLWNPRFCKGDPSFLLHFAPDTSLKISYAASIGANIIPDSLKTYYTSLLSRYNRISIREASGQKLICNLADKKVSVVLDPTLLLNRDQWNHIACKDRIIHKKYILCYFLNYSFDAFPYVNNLVKEIQRQTGYEIVHVARPPHVLEFCNTYYKIGASPEEFLSLIRDAEIVLTTSFHGTAFAVNFGRPLFTVVESKNSGDSRQVDLMKQLGLDRQIISINSQFPNYKNARYDVDKEQITLNYLRNNSLQFLTNALSE